MLRTHRAGVSASVLTVGGLGQQRAQHDMVTFSLSISPVNGFANGLEWSEASNLALLRNACLRCFAPLSMTWGEPSLLKNQRPLRYALTNLFLNNRHRFGERDDTALFL